MTSQSSTFPHSLSSTSPSLLHLTHHPRSLSLSLSSPRIMHLPLHLTRKLNLFRPLMSHFAVPSAAFSAAGDTTKPTLRGVVFDMDGTLTVPVIDFQAMYKAVLGEERYLSIKAMNPSGIDILHHIETFSPSEQQRAYEIIADYERQGLDRLQIMPGAAELCSFLDAKKIRRGLITRNVKSAVDIFHERFGLTFSPALSREYRPYKPDPAPLLHICTTWEIQPSEVIMIGDSLKDDVACGKRAGAYTCLLDETGRYDSSDFADVDHKPDFKVSSLSQVHSVLEDVFDLRP